MKSPMLLGESQNGLYVLNNRDPVVLPFTNSSSSFNYFKDVTSSLSCVSISDVSIANVKPRNNLEIGSKLILDATKKVIRNEIWYW